MRRICKPFSHIIDISPTGPQYLVTFVLVPLLPVILVVCYMEHYITFRNIISHYNTRSESFGRCTQQQSTNDHTPRNRLKGTGFLAKTYWLSVNPESKSSTQDGKPTIIQSDSGRRLFCIVVREQLRAKWTSCRPPRVPPGSKPRRRIDERFFSFVTWTKYRSGNLLGTYLACSTVVRFECPDSRCHIKLFELICLRHALTITIEHRTTKQGWPACQAHSQFGLRIQSVRGSYWNYSRYVLVASKMWWPYFGSSYSCWPGSHLSPQVVGDPVGSPAWSYESCLHGWATHWGWAIRLRGSVGCDEIYRTNVWIPAWTCHCS